MQTVALILPGAALLVAAVVFWTLAATTGEAPLMVLGGLILAALGVFVGFRALELRDRD